MSGIGYPPRTFRTSPLPSVMPEESPLKPVKVYTTPVCPYCVRAKRLLDKKGIDYEEIDLASKPALRAELTRATGWRTVPMIFIGDELVGGCDDLFALDRSGELDRKLAA